MPLIGLKKSRFQSHSASPSTATSSRPESRSARDSEFSYRQNSFQETRHESFQTPNIDDSLRYRAVLKHLYAKLTVNQWLPDSADSAARSCCGLLLRKHRGLYISEPEQIHPALLAVVQKLNVEVAFTMVTETTDIVLNALQPHQTELMLPNGHLLQVIPSLADMASSSSNSVKKFQYAALIRQERFLLVWHDDWDQILAHSASVEGKLLSLICGTTNSLFLNPMTVATGPHSVITSPNASTVNFQSDLKKAAQKENEVDSSHYDEESGKPVESLDRPLALTSAVYVGIALCLILFLITGVGVSKVLYETLVDGNRIRLVLLLTIPAFLMFSLFFAIVIFGNLFQVFGPTKNIATNTRYHSAVKPNLPYAYSQGFIPSHITIQMPVYTESLEGVIIPTVNSLKTAISHYESHGGSASIFVNDDGFAYMTEEQQRIRINYYQDNNIAWVARPKNNSECGYVRKGKFKKASNMNFALNVSTKVEKLLLEMLSESLEKSAMIDPVEEEHYYQRALAQVLESDSRIKAGGDIRIGEYILIVDSDTKVPVDCLLYGAAEMFLSPEVAIVQHSTGVMQVSWDYFENAITFFTNLIYSAIRFAVGSGETAPFVGHNAFLRWQAIQSVGRPDDGYTAYWSESHVSEDFDVALRLQIRGNIVRLASYHGEEFKEGVSLTIYDELARWEKYAYGCNELVFNPVYKWLWKGPFTKLFMTFMWSNLQLSSKITILGYISSYYALASAFPMTTLNYFLVGWFNGYLDKYYMGSWKIFLSLVIVFSLLGNICLAVIRYRLGQKTFLASLFENFKWMPVMAVFFGGLSFHLSLAILAHMFQVNVSWGTTSKEKEDSNFFKEVPKILKGFKWMYLIMIPFVGGMIYLGCFAPHGWRISEVVAVVPMAVTLGCHLLLPLFLNPSLMVFNY